MGKKDQVKYSDRTGKIAGFDTDFAPVHLGFFCCLAFLSLLAIINFLDDPNLFKLRIEQQQNRETVVDNDKKYVTFN